MAATAANSALATGLLSATSRQKHLWSTTDPVNDFGIEIFIIIFQLLSFIGSGGGT